MRRSLVVVTSTGIATRLEWWNTMMVDGSSLVLANAGKDDPELALVVAELGSEEEAQAMFRAVRKCIRFGVRHFDALDAALDVRFDEEEP